MCRSKGMAIRDHISGRGPRSGKDERQRTFRSAHETGAAIPNYNLLRNSATVMAVAMAAFRDSEPLSFLGYGGM